MMAGDPQRVSPGAGGREPDPVAPASRLRALVWLIAVAMLGLGLWLSAGALTRPSPRAVLAQPQTPWLTLAPGLQLDRIAFGSCLDQSRAQPIWKPILEARPQLFVMTGDNVYGDSKGAALTEMEAAYAAQSVQPELAAARARLPFLATWDDHDYGFNDAAGDYPWKAGTRELFARFWQIDRRELPKQGIYRARIVGPPGRRVQIILLDTRTFRSRFAERTAEERRASPAGGRYQPSPDPLATMLGPEQWAWLEAELRKPAEIRLVVSSIQLLAEGHGWERWGHLPSERTRFFNLLGRTAARGVLVLSGDRHRAAIYKRSEGLAYPLHDITSSALNRSLAGAEPDDAGRLAPMISEDNFGLISIDWVARRLRVSLNPLSGREAAQVTIAFTELGSQ